MLTQKFVVCVSDSAKEDLSKIYAYIAYELRSHRNAEGQLQRIEAGVESLSRFPERFSCYHTTSFDSLCVRFMLVDNYMVLYIVDKKDLTVNILRIMYAKCDVARVMLQMDEENKNI